MRSGSKRATMIIGSYGLFVIGILTAALGPALPEFAAHTGSTLAVAGTLFTALFLGALIAQLLAGPAIDHFGQRPLLALGLCCLAVGLSGMLLSQSLVLMLACTVLTGIGHGTMGISSNVLIAEVFADRSTTALNLLNTFFGVGAMAGPAIAGLTLRVWNTALPPLWFTVGLFLLQLPMLPLLVIVPRTPHTATVAVPRLYRMPALWVMAAMLLVYVGIENGMGGWTTTYMERTTTLVSASAALVTAGYWSSLTAGRMLATVLASRIRAGTLLLLCLGGALLGALLIVVASGNIGLSVAGVALVGLSFGPIFPTALALITATYRYGTGTATSVLSGMGSMGGMLLPWLQGVVLDRYGPTPSMMVVACGALAMVLLGFAGLSMLAQPARLKWKF